MKAVAQLAEALRNARLAAGVSQGTVAAAASASRSKQARYESGIYVPATFVEMSELLAVVGFGLSVGTYPLGDGPRDEKHANELASFLAYVGQPLSWRTEVPFSNAGDARSWDAVITGLGKRTAVELERVLRDVQAQSRRIALKRRDGGADFLLLLVADTRANRAVLRRFPTFMPELPRLARRHVIEALAAGHHPGDGLVLF